MKIKSLIILIFLFCLQLAGWSDVLTLINDSEVMLDVVVEDATGTVLTEDTINPGDSTTWSLNYEYYGYEAQPNDPQTPYTVYWYCMSGKLYGTCRDVNSDSSVSAQSCGGGQECMQNSEDE
jgi:hypothetical protein